MGKGELLASKITYTKHLEARLKARKIPKEYPKRIYLEPEHKFFDNLTETMIAIKKLYYNKKTRAMMIAYKEKQGKTSIITIHPITEEKIINRIINQRWSRHE